MAEDLGAPRSRATLDGLDHNSYRDRESPKSERRKESIAGQCRIRTNKQPPQRGGAVPDPVWIGWIWLLAFPRIPVTAGTPLSLRRMAKYS